VCCVSRYNDSDTRNEKMPSRPRSFRRSALDGLRRKRRHLHDGNGITVRRDGVTTQLWLTRAFLGNRFISLLSEWICIASAGGCDMSFGARHVLRCLTFG